MYLFALILKRTKIYPFHNGHLNAIKVLCHVLFCVLLQLGASQESLTDNTSKTTAIVQLSGSVDVLVTPLLLEALQRFVKDLYAVTPFRLDLWNKEICLALCSIKSDMTILPTKS